MSCTQTFRRILFITIYGLLCHSEAIKIKIDGSLHLGKDIMDTLNYHLNQNKLDGRRSMSLFDEVDQIKMVIKFASVCGDLEICRGKIKFVNEYLKLLAKSIEGVFLGIISDNINKTEVLPFVNVLEQQLKECLQDVHKIIKNANKKVTSNTETYVWIGIIKRISAKFQEAVLSSMINLIDADSKEIEDMKKHLRQKLIMGIIIVEDKFEKRLCNTHHLCAIEFECTKTLNTVLDAFKTSPEEKIRKFVQYFYEEIPQTGFYTMINQATAHQLQLVLSEMAFSKEVLTRDIFVTLQKAVKDKLNSLVTRGYTTNNDMDSRLINVIMSDIDYFYSKRKVKPFYKFVKQFNSWLASSGAESKDLKNVMKEILFEIKKNLEIQSNKLIFKITNEVNVFLEITVGPE